MTEMMDLWFYIIKYEVNWLFYMGIMTHWLRGLDIFDYLMVRKHLYRTCDIELETFIMSIMT
jgi:hypothetical protein